MTLGKEIEKAVAVVIANHYKVERDIVKTLRSNKIPAGKTYVERIPLTIEHTGTREGRNAKISIDGCPRTYTIDQLYYRGQRAQPWAVNKKPAWTISVTDPGIKP